MKTKPEIAREFGRIWDASKRTPPRYTHVLCFVDELFDWEIGYYDSAYTIPSLNGVRLAVLYWAPMPPFSLAKLRRISSQR